MSGPAVIPETAIAGTDLMAAVRSFQLNLVERGRHSVILQVTDHQAQKFFASIEVMVEKAEI